MFNTLNPNTPTFDTNTLRANEQIALLLQDVEQKLTLIRSTLTVSAPAMFGVGPTSFASGIGPTSVSPSSLASLIANPLVQQQLLSNPIVQQHILSNPVVQLQLLSNPVVHQQLLALHATLSGATTQTFNSPFGGAVSAPFGFASFPVPTAAFRS